MVPPVSLLRIVSGPAMYQASTIPAQPMYMNNNMNQMSYQPASSQQCLLYPDNGNNLCSSYSSSYMSGIQMCPSDFPMVPQNAPPMPSHGNGWPSDFYHQQQIQQYPQAVTAKPLKRKPSTTPERVSKMPYSQNPAFTFQQASPMMEGGVSPIAPTEEYPVQPMGSHLSPYSPSEFRVFGTTQTPLFIVGLVLYAYVSMHQQYAK
uniref:Protein muscleblind n=1 Tax=Heterorhabditis bacteriophora TaxID=37862 RepID=A0A1I7XCC4_HETBA